MARCRTLTGRVMLVRKRCGKGAFETGRVIYTGRVILDFFIFFPLGISPLPAASYDVLHRKPFLGGPNFPRRDIATPPAPHTAEAGHKGASTGMEWAAWY